MAYHTTSPIRHKKTGQPKRSARIIHKFIGTRALRFLIRLHYELESHLEPWELFTARFDYALMRLFSPLTRMKARVVGSRQRLYIRLEHKFGSLKILLGWFLSISAIFALMELTAGSPQPSPTSPPVDGIGTVIFELSVKVLLFCMSIYLVILTLRGVLKMGQVATPDGRRGLKRLGNWNYGISGPVAAFLVGSSYIRYNLELHDRLFYVVAGVAVVLNSLAVNYCIRQWDYVISAQRDVGKLLFRVAMLLLIACGAVAIGAQGIISSVGSGLSILFVPLTMEAAFVVHKSKL